MLAVLALPILAHAGRRPFLIGHDETMVADGDVEVETWVDQWRNPGLIETPLPPGFLPPKASTAPFATAWVWWAGLYWSPHDDFEVRAFTSVLQRDNAGPTLWAELVSLRWRFLHGDFGSLVAQIDLRIPILKGLLWQASPTLSWSKKLDRFTFHAQAGWASSFRGGKLPSQWFTWDAGAAVDVVKGEIAPIVQVGAEAFSEVMYRGANDFNNRPGGTLNVGPTISFAKGRLWFTGGALFGVTPDSPKWLIRGMVGLAL
ncbi:MAG: hypothetical protein QM723_40175 [Myxococcaceae bacterium]